jgi:hypothetical protein
MPELDSQLVHSSYQLNYNSNLGMETVTDITAKFANSHERKLQNHINIEASRILYVNNSTRWLKRKKLFELVRL